MTRARTLRRRVVVAMVAFTATVCMLYGALAFLFVYVVEDEFFAALLENEAAHVSTDPAARPRLPFVTLYRDWNDVPAEVRMGGTPRSREIAGRDGRHYHVRRIALADGEAWLVAEVSSLLVVRPMRAELLTILLPATALVLLGSSLVAWLVARRSVRQLTSLVDAVQQNRLPFDRELTDGEVRVLADALEEALGRVHALLQREKAFVGDVSHELRTPVAIIRGAAELLERRELDATAAAQVRRIRDAARSSEEIIALLLALAREETAAEARTPIALLGLVEKLVLRHDAAVEIDIAPRTRIVAPPTAAEIVISNLLANALHHGGGVVHISGDERSITIRDRGRGFADADRRGLGLQLVRRLCEVCGFALTIESSETGTTATLLTERQPVPTP
jgi:signal transduction histidine kinase